jgi:hypothetical protein
MQPDAQLAPVSKKMLWTGRVISALPVLFMLFGIGYSFAKPAAVQEGMAKYGYTAHVARIIIFVELLCVIVYVIPQTSVLGAILLTGYLGGATATHVRIEEPAFVMPIIMGVLVWVGLLLRDRRLQTLLPFRR